MGVVWPAATTCVGAPICVAVAVRPVVGVNVVLASATVRGCIAKYIPRNTHAPTINTTISQASPRICSCRLVMRPLNCVIEVSFLLRESPHQGSGMPGSFHQHG